MAYLSEKRQSEIYLILKIINKYRRKICQKSIKGGGSFFAVLNTKTQDGT